MALKNNENGSAARMLWAFFTPVILAFGILCIPLIPALCLYLDGKSRTYTGAATVLVATAALSFMFGPSVAAVCSYVAITTATAYVLARTRVPFATGLLGSAGGGILGTVALLGILGASMAKPISEAAAAWFCNNLAESANTGYSFPLDFLAWQLKGADTGSLILAVTVPAEIAKLSVSDKVDIIKPFLEISFAQSIPSLALVLGMLTGGVAYYLPMRALARRQAKTGEAASTSISVPSFSAFRIPRYVVISILLLQIVTFFGSEDIGIATVGAAATFLFNTLMTIQALAMLSYIFNRRKITGVLQYFILFVVFILLWWVLPWAGVFDAFFDLRTIMQRVEELKAKGKQVFTPDGLNELRKMDEDTNKEKKNDKDGEDGKQ